MDREEMQQQYECVLERENRMIRSGYQKDTNASWTPPKVQVVAEFYSISPLKHPTFTPLIIPSDERIEATFKMLKQHGRGTGGFETDEPVPSLWYADFKALRDGMRARIDDYGEVYEKVVVQPVAEAITEYVEEYRCEYGRHRLIGWQKAISRVYHAVIHGSPWSDIEPRVVMLLPPKYVELLRLYVLRPDNLDRRRDLIALLSTRDGLLDEIRPTVLQWEAARMALRSIARQVPIHDLPNPAQSPFDGRGKSLKYARAIVEAFDTEVNRDSPEKNDLSRAIERRGVDAVNAYKSMRDTMDIREGEDYDKYDVEGYVEAVRTLLDRHKVSKGQGGAKP